MDLKARLDAAPLHRTQVLVITICVALNMLDGYDVLALAFASTAITDEWALSGSQLGLLLSAALFGMAVGSMFVSQVADVVGRRTTILACAVVITAGMALSALAPGYAVLVGLRVVTGVAIGTLQACLNVLVSEYSPARHRSTAISVYAAGQPIGGALGGLVAGALLADHGWRSVFLFGAVATGVLALAVWLVLPESIDYLLTRRPAHALRRLNAILDRLRQPALDAMPSSVPTASAAGRWKDILTGPNKMTTILLGTAFFMLMAGFYFASSWTPRLVTTSGFSASDGVQAGVLFATGGIVGSVLFGPLAARYGVRRTLVAFFTLSGVAFVGYALSTAAIGTAFVAAFALGFLTTGVVAGMFTIGPRSYASAVRATGVGFIIGVGRMGAIVSPIVAGRLVDASWAPEHLYYLFVLPMLVGAGSILALRRRGARLPASPEQEKVAVLTH